MICYALKNDVIEKQMKVFTVVKQINIYCNYVVYPHHMLVIKMLD